MSNAPTIEAFRRAQKVIELLEQKNIPFHEEIITYVPRKLYERAAAQGFDMRYFRITEEADAGLT
jgi:vacuolar-type H+-ATPase subunit D/Vma8